MTRIFIDPNLILKPIQTSVLSTAELLPELREADIVDSGALGMFLFLEGFFKSLANRLDSFDNPHQMFGSKLKLSKTYAKLNYDNYCIDTVIIPRLDSKDAVRKVTGIGDHVVAVSDGKHLKIHLHASDAAVAMQDLAAVGEVLQWHTEKIENKNSLLADAIENPDKVHIVTDAAGSLSADDARDLGITLLDSYIIMDEAHLPESTVTADTLYSAMKSGVKVTTAQASIFERHQNFEYLVQRYKHLVYLCVGSVYTGNYEIASTWASKNANGRQMMVIDSGAASGRLGLIARSVARYANSGRNLSQTMTYAQTVCHKCDELVFLDQLKFLAAGGRITKANGFFGDLLRIKPVIRPGAAGAQKVAVVRSQRAQVEFALDYLRKTLSADAPVQVLLQYTDNLDWVRSHIQSQIQALLPLARISVTAMSLTSGVHMGPGTWSVAFLPGDIDSSE
jgi:DegV family protein with EDD domain